MLNALAHFERAKPHLSGDVEARAPSPSTSRAIGPADAAGRGLALHRFAAFAKTRKQPIRGFDWQ